MSEVSHAKPHHVTGVTKPRPLGYVKRESVHFGGDDTAPTSHAAAPALDHHNTSAAGGDSSSRSHHHHHHQLFLQDSAAGYIFQRSKTDGDFRNELKSMRDLQETLRQAALLNIVAAVNHDGKPAGGGGGASSSNMPTSSRSGVPPPSGIKGDNILRHSLPENSKLVLSHGNSTDHQTGGAFSRHLHTAGGGASAATPATPAAPPNTAALNRLVLERTRTISIPRPRTHDTQQQQQNSFIHSSLVDAKEHLANMTNFRARAKHDASSSSNNNDKSDSTNNNNNASAMTTNASVFPGVLTSDTSSAMDRLDQYTSIMAHNQHTSRTDTAGKEFPSYGLAVEGGRHHHHHHHNHDVNNSNSGNKTDNNNSSSNMSKMSKEEQRAHNVYQMQMLKRHISTTKKRDLVKKLTEMARCEAVDMNQVADVPASKASATAAAAAAASGPGMIILAQQHNAKSASHADGLAAALDTPDIPESANILKRTKSTSSLHERHNKDTNLRVPSNSRVQSETIEAMMSHREKRAAGGGGGGGGGGGVGDEDLRIDGGGVVSGGDGDLRVGAGQGQIHPHHSENSGVSSDALDFHMWLKDQRLMGYTSRPHPYSSTPEVLELRPLAASPLNVHKDKRKVLISRRGTNPVLRDKVLSPSPVVYEATFHKPKASMRHVSLVGQSLPSIPTSKLASFSSSSDKPSPSQPHNNNLEDTTSSSKNRKSTQGGEDVDQQQQQQVKLWNDNWHLTSPADKPNNRVLKPWGSTVRQTMQDSPILRTEILDHLQCVGIVDRRPPMHKDKSALLLGNYKVNGVSKPHDDDSLEKDSDDDDEDDEEYTNASSAARSAMYRKSKLYSAFRASEENLANLAEVSSLVSDTLTARSLLNHPVGGAGKMEPTLPPPPPSRDSTMHHGGGAPGSRDPMNLNRDTSEPRYMGCSSRVSDNEMRSQFHFINDQEEAEAKRGGASDFRVFKALDQDVYYDFQHKKYRGSNTSSSNTALNTAANKPRMHFIKIKYNGEVKS